MSALLSELLIVLLLLVINGVFSMSEIAVVASRRARLEHRADGGDAGARAALELAREPTQFLSTVQVGITLVGVLAGAFGGATLAAQLETRFAGIPRLAPYGGALSLGIVVAIISYLSLIIGELVPKRIALNAPERVASRIARPMRVVSRVVAPMVKLLTGSTNLALRVLGIRGHAEPSVTEEEIRALLEQGAETGVVQEAEHEMVEGVFRIGDRVVSAIMTPRHEIDWLDVTEPPGTWRERLILARHSRLVVGEGSLEQTLGIVHAEDLLSQALSGAPLDLRAALVPPLFVPASMPVLRLLETFRQARQQVAIVLDEYGGVDGLVTLDDILEEIVGDVADEEMEPEPPMVQRADGSWLVDGALPIEDIEERFELELPMEERRGYRTLAGFVLTRLGRLPRAGDHILHAGHRFEVMDMDGRRIDKVLIVPPAGGAVES